MTLKKFICCQKYLSVLVVIQTVVSLIAETIQISSAAISSGTKTLTTEAAETSITPTSDTMQTVAEKSGNATQMTKLSHYYTAVLEATVSVLLYRVYIYIYTCIGQQHSPLI